MVGLYELAIRIGDEAVTITFSGQPLQSPVGSIANVITFGPSQVQLAHDN